nr:S8 family serine peptidase [Aquimarina algiphila]
MTNDQVKPKDQKLFNIYQKAVNELRENIKSIPDDYTFLNDLVTARKTIDEYFSTDKYTMDQLSKIDPKGDTILKEHVRNRRFALRYDMNEEWENYYRRDIEINQKYRLNPEYNGRKLIGDDPNIFGDGRYGNNDLAGDLTLESHGTNVAAIIAATRNNNLGMNGVLNSVKIMPVRIVPRGDEYDKDIAHAIRYAVDNGAKIINMSFGKEYSLNKKFVSDAIKYATKHDVLLICSAGNESSNADEKEFYPNDYDSNTGLEISNSFISVGASSYSLNKWILTYFSNYGEKNVDIFAPGKDIYTAKPNNKYESDAGTSFSAPLVSGIAALIKSYYPKLKAPEIKQILMNSGTSYQINVKIELEDGTKKLVPFSELSKSGKIVNAYNALLMSEQISKSKK